jgi:formylmethanofuran dehydrogenase subunit E
LLSDSADPASIPFLNLRVGRIIISKVNYGGNMPKKLLILQFAILFLASLFCFSSKKDKNIMERYDEFLSRAIEFHGHLGPYLVLGLKAGLFANQTLGRNPMKTDAFVETKVTPPESCFADGIQFSTGCTLGKGNIHLKEGEGLQVTFRRDKKKLILKLKKEIAEEISSLPSKEEAWDNLAKDLYQREIEKIFLVIR